MKEIKKLTLVLISIALAFIAISLPINAKSASDIEHKTYEAKYTIGGTSNIGKNMISKYFNDKVMIERIDDYYFVSFTQTSSSITGLKLVVDDKPAGWMVRSEDGEIITTTFTASLETISSEMQMSCYITKMGMNQSFTITIDFNTLELLSNDVEEIPNRPGYFGEEPTFKKSFPMWGYMAIVGGVLVVAIAGTASFIVIRKKHKNN